MYAKRKDKRASVGWFCQAGYFLIKWLLSSNNVLIWHVCASHLCNFRLFWLGRVFLVYASCILITDHQFHLQPSSMITVTWSYPQGCGTPQGSRLGPIQFVLSQRSRSDRQQALQLSAIFCRCQDAWLVQGIWLPRWAVARRTPTFAAWYCHIYKHHPTGISSENDSL